MQRMKSGSQNAFFRYRGELGAFFFIVLMLIYLLLINASSPFMNPPISHGISLGLILLGLGIRFHVVGYAPARTSGRNKGRQVADQLVTSGMYSLVRHPLYLANTLIWLGVFFWTGYVLLVLLTWGFALMMYRSIMQTEDHFLSAKFGKTHAEWKSKTPAIFPKIIQFKSPEISFNLRKALYREKNGWVAVILAIAIIDAIRLILKGQFSTSFYYQHIITLTMTLIYYLVMKVLYKNTSVLKHVDR